MGSFSFKCIECGSGIKSDEQVHLFLLKGGKVVQQMTGKYDTYGTVYEKGKTESVHWNKLKPFTEEEKKDIKTIEDAKHKVWHQVCDLMHSDNIKEGIAAIHKKCFKTIPTIQSVGDPDQGCGSRKKIANYDAIKDHELEKATTKLWELKRDLDFKEKFWNKESKFDSFYKKTINSTKTKIRNLEKKIKILSGKDSEV